MRVDVFTLVPHAFAWLTEQRPIAGILGDGLDLRLFSYRDTTPLRSGQIDDSPYGGGAGMVMKPEPFFEAVEALGAAAPIVLVSARGRQFTHTDAVRFSSGGELTILCGHYKDVDQRVADHLATEELSLGPFVLSGGEAAALVIVDATVRLLPGAMSDHDSARTDSFYDDSGLSAPSYTRPPEFRGYAVPEVLLSGDHKKIAEWRRIEGERLTREQSD